MFEDPSAISAFLTPELLPLKAGPTFIILSMRTTHKVPPGNSRGRRKLLVKLAGERGIYPGERATLCSRSGRPLICSADVIGRTLIAFEPTAAGVKKLAEGSISGPIFRPSGKTVGEFSRIISKRLSTYPPIFPAFPPTSRQLCVPSIAASFGRWIFSNGDRDSPVVFSPLALNRGPTY